jgi:hypothetical protein
LASVLPAPRLRGGATLVGPDPGRADQAAAVGQPAEGFDAGRKIRCAHRLAAVGGDQVELRRLVLLALLLALADEGDAVAAGRPGRLRMAAGRGGQAARRARARGPSLLCHRRARTR